MTRRMRLTLWIGVPSMVLIAVLAVAGSRVFGYSMGLAFLAVVLATPVFLASVLLAIRPSKRPEST